jgi:hypothetical protein
MSGWMYCAISLAITVVLIFAVHLIVAPWKIHTEQLQKIAELEKQIAELKSRGNPYE